MSAGVSSVPEHSKTKRKGGGNPKGRPGKRPGQGPPTKWKPGFAPNPEGMTYRERLFRAKVRQQDPERVGDVLDALYEIATDRNDRDKVKAAALYLEAVGVLGKRTGIFDADEDMTKVPEAVIVWLAGLAGQAPGMLVTKAIEATAEDAEVLEATKDP